MTIQWTNALAVGLPEIDGQHQELFRRAGQLLDALEAGERTEVVELVEFLHSYAITHFGLEEAWMRETLYPGYVRHKAEHDRFVEDLLELADAHDRGGREAGGAVRLSAWLTEWMIRHIAVTDTEMGRYLAACERPVG
jgi:hemerythrin